MFTCVCELENAFCEEKKKQNRKQSILNCLSSDGRHVCIYRIITRLIEGCYNMNIHCSLCSLFLSQTMVLFDLNILRRFQLFNFVEFLFFIFILSSRIPPFVMNVCLYALIMKDGMPTEMIM